MTISTFGTIKNNILLYIGIASLKYGASHLRFYLCVLNKVLYKDASLNTFYDSYHTKPTCDVFQYGLRILL